MHQRCPLYFFPSDRLGDSFVEFRNQWHLSVKFLIYLFVFIKDWQYLAQLSDWKGTCCPRIAVETHGVKLTC